MLEAVGDAIGRIKHRDDLTYADVGAAFGKSEDVAASYRAGASDMPLSAFLRGGNVLGDEILNAALCWIDRQVAPLETPVPTSDAAKLCPLAGMIAKLAEFTAPESDGGRELSDAEIRAMGPAIEDMGMIYRELFSRLEAARRAGRSK